MQRYFEISCHALMISAFFALALTGRLDSPSVVLFTIGLGVSLFRAIKRMPPPLSVRGAFLLSCAYIVFFLFDMAVLSRSFIPASIHLVCFLQLAKLFQEKTDKDYFYLIVLSFLQVLAASSLTIDMSFVATLFLFLVALVSTLMSFDMYRSERQATTASQRVAAPLGGMSVWATVWIILTALVFFLIIPRFGTGYFTRAGTQALLVSGFNDSVQLGEIGTVKLGTAVVMRARQIQGTPFALVKWRGVALDRFDGRNWSKTQRQRILLDASPEGRYSIRPIARPRDAAQYEILLEPLATNTLFGPHQVRAVAGRLQAVEYDNDDSIYLRFPLARRAQYQVFSEIPERTGIEPDEASQDGSDGAVEPRYLQLPNNIDPRIIDLARDITAKGQSTQEKASLVESYLKRNYNYTLNLTWNPGDQPLSTFLFRAKAGHCEYFASSMAILLRAAGIPTRVVNGFLMGEYNPVGDDYIVRQSDAHSWVEVYAPGRGWMEFDPTPPDPNHREMSLARQLTHYFDAMELFWSSYIIVYDTNSQMQLFRSAQDRVQSIRASLRERSDRWIDRGTRFSDDFSKWFSQTIDTPGFWILLIVIASGGASFKYRRALRTQYLIWKIRRGRGDADEAVIEAMFYRAAQLAAGQKRQPGQTWREWLMQLPDVHRRTILTPALNVFEKSKYGSRQISVADFTCLEDAIQQLRRS